MLQVLKIITVAKVPQWRTEHGTYPHTAPWGLELSTDHYGDGLSAEVTFSCLHLHKAK